MKSLKNKLKALNIIWINGDSFRSNLERMKRILEEMISDILQYRDDHLKVHKNQDKEFQEIKKQLRKLEKNIQFLRDKK